MKDCDITEIKDSEEKTAKQKYTDERKHTFSITFGQKNEDHDYIISVKATDLAGNSNDSVKDEGIANKTVATGKEFTVDMVAPTLDVKYIVYQDENGQEDKNGILQRRLMMQQKKIDLFIKMLQFLPK